MTYELVLGALSDPTRRSIVALIRERPRSVGDLADRLPVSQPAVSQHLKVLREAGLVRYERNGVSKTYHLRPEGFGPLRAYLDGFWSDALEAFRSSFDEPRKETT
jgi:DNA-binding transcriptional ArsR family regulator